MLKNKYIKHRKIKNPYNILNNKKKKNELERKPTSEKKVFKETLTV